MCSKNKKQSKFYPLGTVYQPSQFDVICARGSAAATHFGNRQYRQLIKENVEKYSNATSRREKSDIISSIVQQVKESSQKGGGRFVHCQNGRWYVVGDDFAREKIGQSFRNILYQKYKSSEKAKQERRKKGLQDQGLTPVKSMWEEETDKSESDSEIDISVNDELEGENQASRDSRLAIACELLPLSTLDSRLLLESEKDRSSSTKRCDYEYDGVSCYQWNEPIFLDEQVGSLPKLSRVEWSGNYLASKGNATAEDKKGPDSSISSQSNWLCPNSSSSSRLKWLDAQIEKQVQSCSAGCMFCHAGTSSGCLCDSGVVPPSLASNQGQRPRLSWQTFEATFATGTYTVVNARDYNSTTDTRKQAGEMVLNDLFDSEDLNQVLGSHIHYK